MIVYLRQLISKTAECRHRKVKKAMLMPVKGMLFLFGLSALWSCEKDIMTGQPEWLGNSIYERLQEGIEVNGELKQFTTTLKLIDDLKQKEVLSQTGSKTVFVADDKTFDEWFKTNSWGVRDYKQLNDAQKKMLFNHSMINNAYLLSLMSNVSGNPPHEGMCMRRSTAASVLDTVGYITPDQMPVNPLSNQRLDAWAKYRDAGKKLLIMKDNNSAPMIHFLPAFMQKNNISNADLEVLTNGVSKSIDDAWINGKKVISDVQTCKNGYIYVVDGVIESNLNMAEIIRQTPETSQWSNLIDRFSAPFYDRAMSEDYNRLHNTNDSLYTLRYYSDYSSSGTLKKTPDDQIVPAMLTFDPGWNSYMYTNSMGYDMHYDAGVMIVPTNDALETWWNGAGKGLHDEYGSWENVPALTLSKLLRVNMLPSFIDAVPSKFSTIVDDSKVELGIKPEHVKKCIMGCNGVIYLVDRVFAPSEYRSVAYPALAHQSLMSIIYFAIDNYDFGPFLNSMDSRFSLILPTNAAMIRYIDPCTYGLPQQTMYEFYYDEEEQVVRAHRYGIEIVDGQVVVKETLTDATYTASSNMSNEVRNRLSDLLDNLIVVGDIEDGQKYYKTKAGSVIQIEKDADSIKYIYGGYQMENNTPVVVNQIYDMTLQGNGKSYSTESIPQTSSKSVFETLRDNPNYSLFFSLMNDDDTNEGFFVQTSGSTSSPYYCANDEYNKNVRLFDKYNYTVYVPTNKAIRELIDNGWLPTWEDYAKYTEDADRGNADAIKAQQVIATRIQNFIRYHIQDNSIFIGGAPVNKTKYETSKLNPNNNRFYSLEVSSDASSMQVKDYLGTTHNVVKTNGLYNNNCSEYWIKKTGNNIRTQTRYLYATSHAVVHQIDGALLFDETQKTSWKTEAGIK